MTSCGDRAMKHIPTLLAAIAVLIATLQAYFSYTTRDDHIETVVTGRQLDACAAVGAAASEFGFRAEAAQANFNEETFDAVSAAPRDLGRAAYMAAYLLPERASQDAGLMRDLAQRTVAALAQRDEDRVAELLREFDQANLDVQEACRVLIQDSRLTPGG